MNKNYAIKKLLLNFTILYTFTTHHSLNADLLNFRSIIVESFLGNSLCMQNANYLLGLADWYQDAITKLLRITNTYAHNPAIQIFSINDFSEQELLNLFTIRLYPPSQTSLTKPFITFNLVNNISTFTKNSIPINNIYPFDTTGYAFYEGLLKLFNEYKNLFLRSPTSPFSWMMLAYFFVYLSKYIQQYTLLDIANNPATSFSFTIPQFSNSLTRPIGNTANTYNTLTITVTGSNNLTLVPLITFTFNQILKKQTITTNYTVDANQLLGIENYTTNIVTNILITSTGQKLDDYLKTFMNATTEPFLAYYGLMWFIAGLSKKYPGNHVSNANASITIDMVGYNETAYVTAIPQLTTNPNDLAGNTTPFKPLLRIPLVTHRTTRATQYITAAIPFDVTDSASLTFLNDLLINYVGQVVPQDANYYSLVAQLNPTTPFIIQNSLLEPYNQSFSVQGTVVTGAGEIPIYFQLAYIINNVIQSAPYIRVDLTKLTDKQAFELSTCITNYLFSKNSLQTKTWYHILAWYMIGLINDKLPINTGYVPFLDTQGKVTSSVLLTDISTAFPTLRSSEATTVIGNILRGKLNIINATQALGIPSLVQAPTDDLITQISPTISQVASDTAPVEDFLTRLIALYVIAQNPPFNSDETILEKQNRATITTRTRSYLNKFYAIPFFTQYLKLPGGFDTYPSPLGSFANSAFAQRFSNFNDKAFFIYPTGGFNALQAIINDTATQLLIAVSYLTQRYISSSTPTLDKPSLFALLRTLEDAFVKFYNYTLDIRYAIETGKI